MEAIRLEITRTGDVPDYDAMMSRFITHAAEKIRRRMRAKLVEEKHGRTYARKRGEGFLRSHRASASGEAPASDTGALSRSLEIVKENSLEHEITSNLGYAAILEAGTVRMGETTTGMDPRPLWQPSLDEMLPILEMDLYQMFEA